MDDETAAVVTDLLGKADRMALSDVRANLSLAVERVAATSNPVLITKHGRARAAIVPLSALHVYLKWLADRSAIAMSRDTPSDSDGDVDFDEIAFLNPDRLTIAQEGALGAALAEDWAAEKRAPRNDTESSGNPDLSSDSAPADQVGVARLVNDPVFRSAVQRLVGDVLATMRRERT